MISKEIPSNSRYRDRSVRFTATFNVPTLGRYNFAVAANTGVLLMPLSTFPVYLVDSIYVSATVDEAAFVQALDADLVRVQLRRSSDGQAVFSEPVPTVKYAEGQTCAAYFQGAQQQDALVIDCLGQLTQPAPLIGVAAITLQVGFRIYEITDNDWITRYKAGPPLMV